MPKFRLEMWHSEQCWFSGGRALVCPGGGFYFDTHHNCLAACFPGPPISCLPAAGAGLIGRQRDCNRACQLCAYKMGRESSNR